MFRKWRREKKRSCRVGDLVEVRSQREILATLDSDGKLEGLPFMPEMAEYCGRRCRVFRRADKVFLDHHFYVSQLNGALLLEGVRCDGASHGGCQMGCLMFWKEAWLKPVEAAEGTARTDSAQGTARAERAARAERTARADTAGPVERTEAADPTGHADPNESAPPGGQLRVLHDDSYCCQATELVRAGSPLPWWDVRQYVRDVTSGNMTLGQLARMLWLVSHNMVRRIAGRGRSGAVHGKRKKTSGGQLNLRPGEIVEVRSKEEIEATLDRHGRTRGLGFAPEMLQCCGGRYRVASRVERIVLEWTGRLQPMSDTVILEGVTCNGISRRGCPRDCFQLWREAWLKRVA